MISNNDDIYIRQGAYLPHFEKNEAIYFVTFRLNGSIPHSVYQRIKEERAFYIKEFLKTNQVETINKLKRLFSKKYDHWLDKSKGSCFLSNPKVAMLVKNSFEFYDGKRYNLMGLLKKSLFYT